VVYVVSDEGLDRLRIVPEPSQLLMLAAGGGMLLALAKLRGVGLGR